MPGPRPAHSCRLARMARPARFQPPSRSGSGQTPAKAEVNQPGKRLRHKRPNQTRQAQRYIAEISLRLSDTIKATAKLRRHERSRASEHRALKSAAAISLTGRPGKYREATAHHPPGVDVRAESIS